MSWRHRYFPYGLAILACSLPRVTGGTALECEVCQRLCVLFQEAIEDIGPKSRLDVAAAASKVVGIAHGKNGPCRNREIWLDVAAKHESTVPKLQVACNKALERLEEPMEAALAEPSVRDADLRKRICMAKKPICETLWTDKEVPMSKKRAEKLREEAKTREENEGKENARKAKAFFKANRDRAGVQSFPSGLQMKVLQEGQGPGPPHVDQRVTVHYRGLLIDCIPQDGTEPCKGGTEFDSTFSCKEGTPSAERGACEKNSPISFTSTQAGTFWLEVLPRMREGSHVEVYVPFKLAYGSASDPNKRPAKVGPKAALIFQIQLVKVSEPQKSKDMAIPGAKTTYVIVTPGKEDAATVQVGDTVTVHATGIVAETGKKFWSTKDPGQKPFTYTAGGGVIVGWDMGARGMRKGEVRELKIPSDEGYGENGFPAWGIPPNGDLRFELEVLEIKRNSQEL